MKMTNKDIFKRHQALCEIGKLKLPRKISYAVARNIATLEAETKLITKQAGDIIRRYAAKDENGKLIYADKERTKFTFNAEKDAEALNEELKDLDDIEVDIDIYTFDADVLESCEKDERYDILSPVQEASISWMIVYK